MIVHEAAKTAGFGAEVAARVAEECLFDLLAPVERVTGYDTHIPLFRLEMKYLPSTDKIVAAARRDGVFLKGHRMSHKTFNLPDLGEGLPDATIVEWYVKVGDVIASSTRTSSRWKPRRRWSTPSPVSGKVLKLAGAAGDVIVTGTMLAEFEIDLSLVEPQARPGHRPPPCIPSPPAGRRVPKADGGGSPKTPAPWSARCRSAMRW